MPDLLIENVHMLDIPASETAFIAVRDDRILSVSKEPPDDFMPEQRTDGRGKLAIPGLVNAHTHASMTLLRSYADDMRLMDWLQNKIWPAEALLDGNDIYWGAMLAITEMIKSGATVFADMYYFMDEVARAVEETGIRAVLARGLMGGDDSEGNTRLTENVELYRQWHGRADGRITVMFGPHAPYTCSAPLIGKIIETAGALGAGIHIHLAETQDEVENCLKQNGQTPIAWMNSLGLFALPTLAAHCVCATPEEIAILKEKKVAVAHNPRSNLKLASGVAPVPAMLEAGVLVALGTDGASSNNNQDVFEEMRLAAILHKGVNKNPLAVTTREAIDMATVNGARALGLTECGQLIPGAKADIVLLDIKKPHWQPKFDLTRLLAYAGKGADVDTVIINGRVVLDKGCFKCIDEERVVFEAGKCVAKFSV